jgi:ADP-ribosylglycohydrolase
MRVATSHKGDDDFLSEVSEVVGSGEPAAEAIPAAFAVSARAQGDPAHAIRLAGNLEGDSDTIAAIAGAICGAWAGEDSVPAKWREQVGAVNNLDVAGWAAQLKAIAADHVPEKV